MGLEGARGLLSGIGGTTFGAAATAFSITISVIATASTSYGPRLVGNFMSNRRNQWTLGVLVSTFVYTTLVVRTLRSSDDGAVFVPHLAVHFAIGLAVIDVFLLISFIHHIATSIQVDTLTSVVSSAFLRTAKRSDELACDEQGTTLEPLGQFPPSPPANMRTPLILLAAAAVLTGVFAGPLVRYFERFAAGIL